MPLQRPQSQLAYTIDALDRFIDVNEAYVHSVGREFGVTARTQMIGRSLWDFVPGGLAKQLWQVLQRRVRAIGAPIFLPMRTDSACERRLMDVELHALGNDDIRHVQHVIWSEARPAIALLDRNYPRDRRTLIRCAWCARVQVRMGLWLEIEAAQEALGIQADATLPSVKEGACTPCKQAILKNFPARAA